MERAIRIAEEMEMALLEQQGEQLADEVIKNMFEAGIPVLRH